MKIKKKRNLQASIASFTIFTVVFFIQADFAEAGKEIELTAAMKHEVGSVIRQSGYNCPEPKLAFAEGEDAYGTVIKVYCGPAGQSGVYQKAVFRFTFTPDDRIIVMPWK